jgi:hypothetical protein
MPPYSNPKSIRHQLRSERFSGSGGAPRYGCNRLLVKTVVGARAAASCCSNPPRLKFRYPHDRSSVGRNVKGVEGTSAPLPRRLWVSRKRPYVAPIIPYLDYPPIG